MTCGRDLDVPEEIRPYMGFYVYELEKTESGIRIFCTLHHYYGVVCDCGHETKSQPGEGYVSHVEGRKKDLKLTEYTMVGPMLSTFLAALSVRGRMSRVKIKEFLSFDPTTVKRQGLLHRNHLHRPNQIGHPVYFYFVTFDLGVSLLHMVLI